MSFVVLIIGNTGKPEACLAAITASVSACISYMYYIYIFVEYIYMAFIHYL